VLAASTSCSELAGRSKQYVRSVYGSYSFQ